ncbi:MAG: patatin-like phospholipase family protein [Bdellovibrionales bacterium]|nr:patatin-like phospholipase family protein [Bdellovibrionales bacterium]
MNDTPENDAIKVRSATAGNEMKLGLVLSGGGSRAAYQAGALKALLPFFKREKHDIQIVMGSSIGAVNGLVFSACLKDGITSAVEELESLWKKRNFRNTFTGSPSSAFFRAVRMAIVQYMSPGPKPTGDAIFDPTPLMTEVDNVILEHGGLEPKQRHPKLESIGVMTTIEGEERKPLLFLSTQTTVREDLLDGASFEICQVPSLTAKHGFASAALPSVLPPVEIDTGMGSFRLVDGGISQNVPVDPAARLGADRVIIVDISGRHFWLDEYNEAHDTRPDWEVPAEFKTFCMRPPDTFVIRNPDPFGPILKAAVANSTTKFMRAVGPTWPVFKLLKSKIGESLAYEAASYVALDEDYLAGLIEAGYNDTVAMLRNRTEVEFHQNTNYEELAQI